MKNYKAKTCIVCNESRPNMVCFHHIYTRKARPDLKDKHWNLMPLCMIDHNEVHAIGLNKFSMKYLPVKEWLIDNGWEIDVVSNKWINKGAFY